MPLVPTNDPFLLWLGRSPHLRWVYRDLDVMTAAIRSQSPQMFRDGRDAAQRVREVASDAGYHAFAEGCYQAYEWFCLRLVSL